MLSSNNLTATDVALYLYLFLLVLFVLKYFNMALMRIFQHSQEPCRENALDINNDIANLKETIKEKETEINISKEKMKEFEARVDELTQQNVDLHRELDEKDEIRQDMDNIVINYEKIIGKLMREHKLVKIEREMAKSHLANLELAFHDLIEKYERAKTIVKGYERNEKSFRDHLAKFESAVEIIENKYTDFKTYAIDKLNEANHQLKKNEKDYMQEVSKLKAKIIQSQGKINDMERQISRMSLKIGNGDAIRIEPSIFEPLVNNIT